MKKILALSTLFCMLFLMSCETDHYYTQYIDNQSTETLTFHFNGSDTGYYGDSITVSPGERKSAYDFYKLGAQPDGIECVVVNNSFAVSVSNGMELLKDFSSEGAWETEISGKRTVMQTCTFSVTDADLQ